MVSQINNNLAQLGSFTPVIDDTGKITGYTTTKGGADTVFPFSFVDLTLQGTYSDKSTVTVTIPQGVTEIIVMTASATNSTNAFVAGCSGDVFVHFEELLRRNVHSGTYGVSVTKVFLSGKEGTLTINLGGNLVSTCNTFVFH